MASDLFSLCSSKQWAVPVALCLERSPTMQVREMEKKEAAVTAVLGKRRIGSVMTAVLEAAFPTSKVLLDRLILRAVPIPPPVWLDFWVASAA